MPRRPTTSAPGSPRPRCSSTATPARRSVPPSPRSTCASRWSTSRPACAAGAGNRTPFPEELNRRLIARIASLHLAPTTTNQENLVRENIPIKQVFVTGNTAIDALRWASELDVPFVDPAVKAAYESDRRIVLVTAHRRENWGEGLRGIGEGVARLATRAPRRHVRASAAPEPAACSRVSGRCCRSARTWCSASRWATPSSRACWRVASL